MVFIHRGLLIYYYKFFFLFLNNNIRILNMDKKMSQPVTGRTNRLTCLNVNGWVEKNKGCEHFFFIIFFLYIKLTIFLLRAETWGESPCVLMLCRLIVDFYHLFFYLLIYLFKFLCLQHGICLRACHLCHQVHIKSFLFLSIL